MTEEQKDILIARIVECPGDLSDSEISQILGDAELVDIYNISRGMKAAKRQQRPIDADTEWRRFKPEIASVGLRRNRIAAAAAIVAGVLAASVIALMVATADRAQQQPFVAHNCEQPSRIIADTEERAEAPAQPIVEHYSQPRMISTSMATAAGKMPMGTAVWDGVTVQFEITEPWMWILMEYIDALNSCGDFSRRTYAGYIYEVTKNIDKYPNVTEEDRQTVRKAITALMADERNSDTQVQLILKGALDNVK